MVSNMDTAGRVSVDVDVDRLKSTSWALCSGRPILMRIHTTRTGCWPTKRNLWSLSISVIFSQLTTSSCFFPDSVFTLMKEQSNLHRTQMLAGTPLWPHSRLRTMDQMRGGEMEAFFALKIAVSLCNKPAISNYWSMYWPTRLRFCNIMSQNHFENLNYSLHFSDNSKWIGPGQEWYDPLFKFRELLNIVDPLYTSALDYHLFVGHSLSIACTFVSFTFVWFVSCVLP